jgi:NAD+ synthase
MLTLYYFANKLNYLVVGTGNKTELEIGYFTKYGDGGVDLLPLGGLYKREVGELAVQLEVPPEIIKKPPSAGLWNGQTDEKEIGLTYPTLDEILFALAKGKKLRATPAVRKVRELIKNSQHKREGVRIFSPK